MPNNTKRISFNAFQFDLHRIKKTTKRKMGTKITSEVYTTEWDYQFVYQLFHTIFDNEALARKMNVNDEWFVLLNDLQQDQNYIYGNFKSASYGTKSKLVHADTLATRENPKDKREGEETYTHFIIRKEDGFMLLQTTEKRMSRSRIQSYLTKYGEDFIKKSKYNDINICSLISVDLINDIKNLDKVKSTILEISAEEKSDENEFILELQDEIDTIKGTHVTLEFKAKYSREGLSSMIPFIQRYKGQKGVTSIKVLGEQAGAERTFNVDSYNEKYRPAVKVDGNNNPISENVYEKIKEICKSRHLLKRSS